MSIYDVFSGGSKPFDKEQWAAQKQAQRKEAYELIDNTCSEMMSSGNSFRQYGRLAFDCRHEYQLSRNADPEQPQLLSEAQF